MENWGLVTYREPFLLWNKITGTLNAESTVVRIMAHEIAHMWFGNWVTPKWSVTRLF
jgi:aminopeptidase N